MGSPLTKHPLGRTVLGDGILDHQNKMRKQFPRVMAAAKQCKQGSDMLWVPSKKLGGKSPCQLHYSRAISHAQWHLAKVMSSLSLHFQRIPGLAVLAGLASESAPHSALEEVHLVTKKMFKQDILSVFLKFNSQIQWERTFYQLWSDIFSLNALQSTVF